MSFKEVDFFSACDISRIPGQSDAIVISVRNPNEEKASIQDGFKDVLHLEFDNITHLSEKVTGIRFSLSHAQEVLAFLNKHVDTGCKVLVNCTYGESRSAGIAFYIALTYGLDIDDGKLAFMNHWVVHVLERAEEQAQMHQALPAAA